MPQRQAGPPFRRQRRTLSCLPCRIYKLRCDRIVPCQSCIRHGRSDRCQQNPPPTAALTRGTIHANSALPRLAAATDAGSKIQSGVQSRTVESFGTVTIPVGQSERGLPRYFPEVNQQQYAYTSSGGAQDLASNARGEQGEGSSSARLSNEAHSRNDSPTVSAIVASQKRDLCDATLLDEPVSYWRRYLVETLPPVNQCDLLVTYFFENVNWMYQAIHGPSFRAEYAALWSSRVEDVDLIWLSLLYMILCLGAFFIPSAAAEVGGLDPAQLPKLHRRWYSASRQALFYGGHDSKPTLTQIQLFIISQTYWYSTKNVETLNSHMAQAVRNAQAIGLDKKAPSSITNCVEREMRHRVWWDVISSDTFQSMCLGRPPLLQAHLSTVPFPSNCRDEDLTPTGMHVRPLQEPTELIIHHIRAVIFKVLNRLYIDNGAHLSSFEFVASIDTEVCEIMDGMPEYLQGDAALLRQMVPPKLVNVITWMLHVLQSCICIHRIRMFRPFLNPRVGDAWERCIAAGSTALSTYKAVRSADVPTFKRSQKMQVHAYQIFSAAVSLSTFLLVEMPSNAASIRADIEMIIEDLHFHSTNTDEGRRIPLISDGWKIIRRIVALYDARRQQIQTPASGGSPDDAPTSLVPAISSVFGGASSARSYLERCTIDYIIGDQGNDVQAATNSRSMEVEGMSLNEFMDFSSWSLWEDAMWADLNFVMSANVGDA